MKQINRSRVLGMALSDANARCRELEDELRRVIGLLPEPIWNSRGVLIWSLLDADRIRVVLGMPSLGDYNHDPLCSQGVRAGDQVMPCDCKGRSSLLPNGTPA